MNVLLVRTDRIGDLILSTPAIASVRASFPEARVTMVTSNYNAVVMERNTDVDERVSVPRSVRPSVFAPSLGAFDIALALAPREADLQIVRASRARVRVGYTYVRRWLARATLPFFVNRRMVSVADPELCERNPSLRVPHEVDQLLELVALCGATHRVSDLRLDVTADDRAAVAHFPRDPIVLHLGTRWFGPGSTLENTLLLARELATLGPLVLSLPEESGAYRSAFESLGCAIAANLPFFHWAALFERAACIVTVDTGATHVASAMRRPAVVAFEHRYFRLSSQEWAPYGVPHVLVRKPENADVDSLQRFRGEILSGVRSLMTDA